MLNTSPITRPINTAEVAHTSQNESVAVALSAAELIFLPNFRLNKPSQILTRMATAIITTETTLYEFASGLKIFEIDSFISSKPTRIMMKEIISPAMYSILPCPKGWSSSSSLFAILKPA